MFFFSSYTRKNVVKTHWKNVSFTKKVLSRLFFTITQISPCVHSPGPKKLTLITQSLDKIHKKVLENSARESVKSLFKNLQQLNPITSLRKLFLNSQQSLSLIEIVNYHFLISCHNYLILLMILSSLFLFLWLIRKFTYSQSINLFNLFLNLPVTFSQFFQLIKFLQSLLFW